MLTKPTYIVQGHLFVLKPTSPRNRKLINAFLEEQGEKISALEEKEVDAISNLEELSTLFDEYKSLFDLFVLLTDGPHGSIEYDDFDVKIAEVAIADFFPSATATVMRQVGFLSS